jgi:hypothetical protein
MKSEIYYIELGTDFIDFIRDQDQFLRQGDELYDLLHNRCTSSNANIDYSDRENYKNVKLKSIQLYTPIPFSEKFYNINITEVKDIDLYYSHGRISEDGANISVATLTDAWDKYTIDRIKSLAIIWERDNKLNQILK